MEKTENKNKRKFDGQVVSAKTEKTITVLVKTKKMHPKYKKQYLVSKKFAVHDEQSLAKEGDLVLFEECRPISKTKKWKLSKVLNTK
ncbi:MAG: 30S ribosomal protein S17 [Patescibacteria group bacterium]